VSERGRERKKIDLHFHSKTIGISEKEMEDPAQKEAIYAFVEENDVIEEMRAFQDPRLPSFAEKQKSSFQIKGPLFQ